MEEVLVKNVDLVAPSNQEESKDTNVDTQVDKGHTSKTEALVEKAAPNKKNDETTEEEAQVRKSTSLKRSANDNEQDDVVSEKPDIKKPVKRARSAYFIFADDKRSHIQEQHPGQAISVVARALGQMWSSMTAEEKMPYHVRAAEERMRVEKDLEAWKAAGGIVPEPQGPKQGRGVSLSSVDLPVARVKKICKLDPEVKNLTKEGLLMVTKAAELVLVKLGKECVKTAQIQNRRKLLPDDLAQVCSVREQFLFLREDIQDLHRHLQTEVEATKQTKSKKEVAKVGKPITDFFKSTS